MARCRWSRRENWPLRCGPVMVGHPEAESSHTHTQPPSRQDLLVAGLTPHTPAPVGWSATEKDIAAPLLASQGGLRTTDVDGATWVVEQ